ncbi:hypothetical protein [Streptomyces sp. NPDC056479]|uniref:hypothetical protein n=1 Tax=unclassified Streptomyces TaxID=2593676 RepID=UPI0036977108
MRATPIAASALALGALLGGFTASSDADAPESVQQRTVAAGSATGGVVLAHRGNNGNG